MIESLYFYTQEEAVTLLNQQGYSDITVRTLTYWRSEGLLPELTVRKDGRKCYPAHVINQVRVLADASKHKTSPINLVSTITIEDREFLVHKITISRQNDGLKIIYHTLDGILVLPLSEEELNAITRKN